MKLQQKFFKNPYFEKGKEWIVKVKKKSWESSMQIALILLLCGLIFGAAFCKLWMSRVENRISEMETADGSSLRHIKPTSTKKCYWKKDSTELVCKNLDLTLEEDQKELNDQLDYFKNNGKENSLELCNTQFVDDVLSETWLHRTKPANVNTLTLDGGVAEIRGPSFNLFPNLSYLMLKNNALSGLSRGTFQNIKTLKILLIFNNSNLKYAEENLLAGLSIEALEIHNIELEGEQSETFFKNVTANASSSLKTLDWSDNSIEYMRKEFLIHFSKLETMNIQRLDISRFEQGGFENLKELKQIYLKDNRIEKLPENIFRVLFEKADQAFFMGNPLICDCDMEWVQIFIRENKNGSYGDFQQIRCADEPREYFMQANMCGENSTSSSTTTTWTTPTTTKTSTSSIGPSDTPPTGDLQIECDYNKEMDLSKTPNQIQVNLHKGFFLQGRKVQFNINEADNEMKIHFPTSASDFSPKTVICLRGFESESGIKNNCITNITENELLIKHVEPETTYLICAVGGLSVDFQLLDCTPHTTKPAPWNRTWLSEGLKPVLITVMVFSVLFSGLLGSVVLYVVVRKNPILIRGSKKVIVVKKRTKNEQFLIMPTKIDTQAQPKRKCSDAFSTISYISVMQPTANESVPYRMARQVNDVQIHREPPSPTTPRTSPSLARLPRDMDHVFDYDRYTIEGCRGCRGYVTSS